MKLLKYTFYIILLLCIYRLDDSCTPIDEEIAVFAMFLLENGDVSAEHKKLAAQLFHWMAKSPSTENMLYQKQFIGQMCFMVQKCVVVFEFLIFTVALF